MPLDHPRISPLPQSEQDLKAREVLETLPSDIRSYNIFATLARHPKLFKRWLVFGNHIMGTSSLPPRDREIIILRMGWLCRAEYEWGHHVAIGKKEAGLCADDIQRIAAGPEASGLDPLDAVLVRAVDELHSDCRIGDSTWKALSARYNTQQMLDLLFTAGQYSLVCMALNSMGVQLEEGFEGFPHET